MFPRPTYPDKVTPIIRPNPEWEEDLIQTVVVGPSEVERWKSYPAVKKPRQKKPCFCQVSKTLGVAPRIKLNDGRSIPNFGIGTWLGYSKKGVLKSVEDDAVEKAVGWAIDAGYRHIDTASVYGTEAQVGRAVNAKIKVRAVTRKDLYIVTKLWNDRHFEDQVVPALQESLSRLQLDYVDLYLIHFPVAVHADDTFYESDYTDVWRGMVEARDRGLARSVGVSNFNVTQLDRLMASTHVKPAVLQVEVNLHLQQPELLSFCRHHAITVTAHTPLGELVAGRVNIATPVPRIDDTRLMLIANKYHKTVPQIVLRYLMELGVIPIPKSLNQDRIKENIDIFDFKLTPAEKTLLASFDKGYRTVTADKWKDSVFYPFEK